MTEEISIARPADLGAVMAAGLRRAAEDGLPAVVETSKPANVDLYRRAGWRVLSEFSSPFPTWIMTR
ncbi:putative acetyltransferase [Actinoplanes campanulatus]|uniref:Putative acetyltransferase n=1 Tax=Actinoplanes campanulatus TaxID=113559 RepID=A0A7W5ACK6_9ACTN|nr:putative acetyltransferase [Actinoplanes campanulatus]GGN05738.1 hypothetical protein GCM10010109_13180 [Actinoplanes campanulatus]GID35126.1 hypothetical protein Aca09nite_16320 [Actinoplanes campanulatus]